MNIKDISIKDYLAERNIHPAKVYGHYGMYRCPFREDRNASFKVDYRKNLWNDFGTGEGGSIMDLVMKMENLSFHDAAKRLECTTAYMHTSSQADIFFFSSEKRFGRKSIKPTAERTCDYPPKTD
jgi:hypothetical protein